MAHTNKRMIGTQPDRCFPVVETLFPVFLFGRFTRTFIRQPRDTSRRDDQRLKLRTYLSKPQLLHGIFENQFPAALPLSSLPAGTSSTPTAVRIRPPSWAAFSAVLSHSPLSSFCVSASTRDGNVGTRHPTHRLPMPRWLPTVLRSFFLGQFIAGTHRNRRKGGIVV